MTTQKSILSSEEIQGFFNRTDTFAAHLGIEIVEATPEHGVASMPLTKAQRNGMGHAHGGAIFALADMAFAAAAHSAGIFFVNAQSSISYLAPGILGPLRGEAKAVRQGKRLGTYEVRITDADGTLVALAVITGCTTGIAIASLDHKA